MEDIKRYAKIDLPKKQSAFLWGPRKTGKTTFLRKAFPDSAAFNFLEPDFFLK